MAIIHTIREKITRHEYEFAIPHFFEEMAEDNLIFKDIEMVIAHGRIRRKFTRDPRGTRYEVVGAATDGREIAVICRIKGTGKLLLITTYAVESLS
ncbi:MAG: DUF4258 domain-containing protein [Proteobacteria bacterium]|nr:DUF4258 domain-containing protein [Pseudomonadota bacterium]